MEELIKEEKLVSIIVPAYNVENFIDKCLESLLAQTYRNLEILVVDDGSVDNTFSHIQKYQQMDARVKGFRRENAGVSATRNFAIEQANGYYLQFVDSDDYLSEDAVATLVYAIESSKADWINCQYNRVDEQGNLLDEYCFIKGFKETVSEEERFKLIRDQLIDYLIGYEVWNKLFITSIVKDNGICFLEDCHIGEDLAFNICYAMHAKAIKCIENRIYYYLIRTDSAMGQAADLNKNFKEHLALVKGIEGPFNKAFTGEMKNNYYQIFYKLMLHASHGFNAMETAKVAEKIADDFYLNNLKSALSHKKDFTDFCRQDLAKMYFRYGLFIKAQLTGNIIDKLYLKLFDAYRKLRNRSTISEWELL